MTALAANRDIVKIDSPRFPANEGSNPFVGPLGQPANAPVEANTHLYAGALVAFNTAGNACRPQDAGAVKIAGVAEFEVNNTGAAGSVGILIRTGQFPFVNGAGADAIVDATSRYVDVYAIDDQTVAIDSAGGTRLRAGYALAVLNSGQYSGQVVVQVAAAATDVPSPAGGGQPAGTAALVGHARAVATSLATYTGSGTGTLTASANGAIGAQDGVTLAVGDILLIPAGTVGASTVATKDAGPWSVVSVGGAGKYQLTRPSWWSTGAQFFGGATFFVGNEGTLFPDTEWFVDAAATGNTVDTTAAPIYPTVVTQQITLAAGVFAVTNVPFRSATKSTFGFSRTTGNNCSTTVQYNPVTITPGALGTATVTLQAQVAAGTIQNTDTSVGLFSIINR